MTLRIDIRGLSPDRLLFAPSPSAELTAMLHVLSEPGHHPQFARCRLVDDVRVKNDLVEHRGLASALRAVSSVVTLAADGNCIVVDRLQDKATRAHGHPRPRAAHDR